MKIYPIVSNTIELETENGLLIIISDTGDGFSIRKIGARNNRHPSEISGTLVNRIDESKNIIFKSDLIRIIKKEKK